MYYIFAIPDEKYVILLSKQYNANMVYTKDEGVPTFSP